MSEVAFRDASTRRLGGAALRDELVRRFGAQRATTLFAYYQLVSLRGPVEARRVLGSDLFDTALTALHEAGFETSHP
jgi:hypothetical protein